MRLTLNRSNSLKMTLLGLILLLAQGCSTMPQGAFAHMGDGLQQASQSKDTATCNTVCTGYICHSVCN